MLVVYCASAAITEGGDLWRVAAAGGDGTVDDPDTSH